MVDPYRYWAINAAIESGACGYDVLEVADTILEYVGYDCKADPDFAEYSEQIRDFLSAEPKGEA